MITLDTPRVSQYFDGSAYVWRCKKMDTSSDMLSLASIRNLEETHFVELRTSDCHSAMRPQLVAIPVLSTNALSEVS